MSANKRPLRRFGLIGDPLEHSLSPFIHERIMEAVGIKGEYGLYPLPSEQMEEELPGLLADLAGLNITIPHKRTIIPYLEGLAPSAQLYGAVNTVCAGVGYNTDGEGFRACQVQMKGRSVLVLGAGGVSRVMALEAGEGGASVIGVKARNEKRARELVQDLRVRGYKARLAPESAVFDVVLNGTPLGMWPAAGALALEEGPLAKAGTVFDAVYNPSATRLVLKAKSRGIRAQSGLKMLWEQALAAQRLWNPASDFWGAKKRLAAIAAALGRQVLRQSPLKIVLTGFMGSGKTFLGRALSQRLSGDLPFVDLDEIVVQRSGRSIADLFELEGEEGFRKLERECLRQQLCSPGSALIATGGGALVQQGAAAEVHAAGALIIYLDAPFSTIMERIDTDGVRPLLKGGPAKIRTLYESRRPFYEQAADLTVSSNVAVEQIVETILDIFQW